MDTDMVGVDRPRVRVWPVRQWGLSPALMWDDMTPSLATTEGGVLACPWCGLSSRLHLAGIYYATPTPQRYWPSFGVDIDVLAAMVIFPGVEAIHLHAGGNDGVMLAMECWCANGCRGRLEFRQHQDEDGDVVVLNLVALPGLPPDDVDPDADGGPLVTAGDTGASGPPS